MMKNIRRQAPDATNFLRDPEIDGLHVIRCGFFGAWFLAPKAPSSDSR